MTTSSRRTKWHPSPPPPPSPKIIYFPHRRRTRRKQTKLVTHHHQNNPLLLMHQNYLSYKGKLETFFDQETNEPPATNETPMELLNCNSKSKASTLERRERVEEVKRVECGEYNGGGRIEEEKWRFQSEMLRAECNLLRMERELALKKLEKNRVKMERTLRSAVQTLVSGREKIFEGKNVNAVLEEEIEDLEEKLEELQKIARNKDSQVVNCSNFDKKACLLQRRLEKLGELSDESSISNSKAESKSNHNVEMDVVRKKMERLSKNVEMDVVRKKMERLSKVMLDRVEEEYDSMVSICTANSSVASSASTSKRIEFPELSCFSTRHLFQEAVGVHENKCSGRCKAIVRRIVEQVRGETEQWSQMQEMLVQVRGEMEELQASRHYWENRAHDSDYEIQFLRHAVEEWKEKAIDYENKANGVQLELTLLKEDMQKSEVDDLPLAAQLVKERLGLKKNINSDGKGNIVEETGNKELPPPLSLGKQLAQEKRMLLRCHTPAGRKLEPSEEDGRRKTYSTRSPLRDINENLSPISRQNRRAASDLHTPATSRTRESFRMY